MDLNYLIDLIAELPQNERLKYVRGEKTCVFLYVDKEEPRVFAKNSAGDEKSWAPTYLTELASKITENVPYNLSILVNNSGTYRTVIDTIIAHTREFYWVKNGNAVQTVWVPSKPKTSLNLEEISLSDIPPVSGNNNTGQGMSLSKSKDTLKGKNIDTSSLQQIFYGAPGTGKSYHVKEAMSQAANVRTTFHPDSDYATFVGAYKPTMKRVPLRDLAGHVVKDDNTKQTLTEEQIVYQFVPQAFLRAYVGAWSRLDEPFYLVIEEINRGNCAQIFGDLFQLLDRDEDGGSSYPIDADDDIRRYLGEVAFAGLSDAQRESIGREDIIKGERLSLPPNLHIWATMNTSDQSLFPIDSAFKRRWDWTYMPINDAGLDWKINCRGRHYDWWRFLETVNDKVEETTDSEDKKLGYFFVQADQKCEISSKRLVGKVVFYLWNDVFKDYGFDDAMFTDADGSRLTFRKFFHADGTTDEDAVERLLSNLGLEAEESDLTGAQQ